MAISKVFRLHESSEGEDWFTSGEYSDFVIKNINDPNWGDTSRQITSIPSPFARIDLVKTAFNVVNNTQVDGRSVYHKIVSDALDVGQIFYIRNELREEVEIVSWDPHEEIPKLASSPNDSHRLYGESLKLFWDADAENNNFSEFNKFFILKYRNEVIGGTSPTTLFFATANDLSKHIIINFDNDKAFDDKYAPLFRRDPGYQKYLYSLRNEITDFAGLFKELEQYLDKNLTELREKRPDVYSDVVAIKKGNPFFGQLDKLQTERPGEAVEVFGTTLRAKQSTEMLESDFTIDASKRIEGRKPLVLQNYFSNPDKLIYHGAREWRPSIEVPYKDPKPPEERKLPESETLYPYLTVSDLLEPYLIRLVYNLNEECYYTGNYWEENRPGYLIPLKPVFFDYFEIEDIQVGTVHDGKRIFEFDVKGESVTAILRIPIQRKHYITFERTYYPPVSGGTSVSDADEKNNKGWIVEQPVSFAIFPFLKIDPERYPEIPVHIRVQSVEMKWNKVQGNKDIELMFFDRENQPVEYDRRKRSDKNAASDNASSIYYSLNRQFEYLQVNTLRGNGLLIPIFPKYTRGNDKYRFAVDFGTTYTHVEVQKNGNDPTEFTVGAEDLQIATSFDKILDDASVDLKDLVDYEMVPPLIEKGSDHSFPLRTTISELYSIDYALNNVILPLAEMNIPFLFEKKVQPKNANITSNLKWSNYHAPPTDGRADEKRVINFIEVLIFMIRNKVLTNNGNLNNCSVVWFYPVSMLAARRNKLERIWHDAWVKYTGVENPDITAITESIAPFYFYSERGGINAIVDPAVSIDIGGETVDVVVYQKDTPIGIASARFGANAIYGDGFNSNPEKNGYIKSYREPIKDILEKNKLREFNLLTKYFGEGGNSADQIAFYFSLESNSKIRDSQLDFSFSKMLADDDRLKYIYLIYFTAVLYQTAQYFKHQDITMPGNIIFSGTASKMIDFIDNSIERKHLKFLIDYIFSKVYDRQANLKIHQDKDPKKVTAKGGIFFKKEKAEDYVPKYSPLKYSDIIGNENSRDEVIEEILKFVELFADGDNVLNYHELFNVERGLLENIITFLNDKKRLVGYYELGLKRKVEELQGKHDIDIEEPFFYYPLIGMLNELAYLLASGEIDNA
jgi:hypothetical protein